MLLSYSPLKHTLFCLLVAMFTIVKAQVKEVHYMIKFNEATQLHDCYIVISKDSATTLQQRTQLSSQFSVVVPAGSNIVISQNYMPLQNNQNYTGTFPCLWTLGNQILSPAVQPQSDFYGITPSLVPACQYNNLYEGDTIKIFSLSITIPQFACKSNIRLFQNGIDPGAAAPGMGGGDFSNGFTVGNPVQRYKGNLSGYLPSDKVLNSQDNGFGSLRKAVFCAKNNEAILVEDSLAGKTISLLTPIIIDKNIHILRSPTSSFTIKAPAVGSAFLINSGKSLNIKDVNFIASSNLNTQGRIFLNFGSLTLQNVVLHDNNISQQGTGSTINNKGDITVSGSVILEE